MALSLGRIIRHVARRRQRRPPHPGTPVENARDDSTPGRIPGQSSARRRDANFAGHGKTTTTGRICRPRAYFTIDVHPVNVYYFTYRPNLAAVPVWTRAAGGGSALVAPRIRA